MPWAKRADGTWGNVAVEAPVVLPASDSDSDEEEDTRDIKATGSVAARAAQFQAAQIQIQKASPARAAPPPPSSAKKKAPPPPPADRTPPPPPPYAPAIPPRRTTPTVTHDDDDAAELADKVSQFEPKLIRPRVISNSSSIQGALRRRPPPPPAAPAARSTEEEDTSPSRRWLPHRRSRWIHGLRCPLDSRRHPRRRSRLDRHKQRRLYRLVSRHNPSPDPHPHRPSPPARPNPHTRPPLPPRSTPSAPPLPARSTSSLVEDDDDYDDYEEEPDQYEQEEEEEKEPTPRTPASSSRNPNLRPPPSRTTSSSSDRAPPPPRWSNNKTGFAKKHAVDMARNRRNCLNPPPACFSREPPPLTPEGAKGIAITYAPLPAPVILRSNNSNDLAKAITAGRAFPTKPPPFLSHDVTREDWNKLWDDIDETARIEMRASAGLSVATLPLMPIFGAGMVVSTVAERKLRAGRVGPTCKLVEAWNVNFFRPRCLDVYIAQDSIRLSGPTPTTASRQAIDPAFLKWQHAPTQQEKQLAMKEYERYEGKFRFVVQSWPLGGV
ncbi:hypothetical protein MSAN_00290000 [Mycena sanguinolenta]|uniref:Uncharacterized protein n=1 Tax=Mycena sanguinolenta TaxID=230812 RepID=A0A8H6ZED1_9AGAR|nr:hypothetical protein MSAN_00290000 [Mycena sanguinolenta]